MTTGNVTIERLSEPHGLMEGPHWDHEKQRLYFVEIFANKILCYHMKTGKIYSAYIRNGPVGVIIPVENCPNKFVIGCGRDLLLVTWDGESNVEDLKWEKLASVEADRTDTRFNDGKVDASGRLWIGTMGQEQFGRADPNRGTLYSIGSDLVPVVKVTPVTISNGLEWNDKNDIMYYIDSPTLQVHAFDFDLESGSIINKRVAFDLKKNNVQGIPDGMTMDTNGNLWVATFLGSKVINVDPRQGKLIRTIDIPAKNVTSVAFGGPNLDILYVTTATHGLTEAEKQQQPEAGCLFAVKGLGVSGRLPKNMKLR